MGQIKINIWTAIYDIVACFIFATSWFVIFDTAVNDAAHKTHDSSGAGIFFYTVAWIGVVSNAVASWQRVQHHITLVGGILGDFGTLCFGISAVFAFPEFVSLIIEFVFLFLTHPRQTKQVA